MTPHFYFCLVAKLMRSQGRALFLWIRMLATHAFLFYAFYAWKVLGVVGAGNLFQFFVGVVAGCSALLLLAPAKHDPDYDSEVRAHIGQHARLLLSGALVWYGEFALATALLVSTAIMAAHRNRCIKAQPSATSASRPEERKA